MQRIAVNEISPGAELAKPVLDSQGRVLLREGARLTANVIACLERWGFTNVFVRRPEPVHSGNPSLARHWEGLFGAQPDSVELQVIHAALVRWERSLCSNADAELAQ